MVTINYPTGIAYLVFHCNPDYTAPAPVGVFFNKADAVEFAKAQPSHGDEKDWFVKEIALNPKYVVEPLHPGTVVKNKSRPKKSWLVTPNGQVVTYDTHRDHWVASSHTATSLAQECVRAGSDFYVAAK